MKMMMNSRGVMEKKNIRREQKTFKKKKKVQDHHPFAKNSFVKRALNMLLFGRPSLEKP